VSLEAAIRELGRKGPRCTYSVLYDRLTPEQQDELDACMADVDLTSSGIAKGISSEWGLQIGAHVVNRHRNEGCSCGAR